MYEYEDVARRPGVAAGLSPQDITNILDMIYQDPGDDAIIEAAIAGRCDYVVSFNERHLRVAREFGIEVLKPSDLLKLIGEIK
jgi:predicted nucleic acid-binding protein